jgi:hypothetical protein
VINVLRVAVAAAIAQRRTVVLVTGRAAEVPHSLTFAATKRIPEDT